MTQITSEATQESKTSTTEMLYCIKHECMVEAYDTQEGKVHTDYINVDGYMEATGCFFPDGYAYSAPNNDLPDDWAKQEPDDDQKAELELAEIGEWLGME